jgi:hypothetical protein
MTDIQFADAEIVAVAGAVVTLAHAPKPPESLQLFKNGLLMTRGADYMLAGALITMPRGWSQMSGDTLVAFYRY